MSDVYKLPADIARCNGTLYGNGTRQCPQRENCLRFKSTPHGDGFNQVWLYVVHEGTDCKHLLEIENG